MFTQTKKRKGVSPIIGYILLVTFVIVLGVIVYNWMKTYVPQNDVECPSDTSIFIKEYSCNSESLNLTIKNNGKFNVGGYFIYATISASEELATKDLSIYLAENFSQLSPTGVKFTGELNSLKPNEEEIEEYNMSNAPDIYSVEIIPIRWQKEGRISRLVSCANSRIKEVVVCG